MAFNVKLAAFLVLATLTSAFAIQRPDRTNETYPSKVLKHNRRAGPDPADFSWIKRWVAMGDSFTAGIGSGNFYTQGCSRYDHSYPAIIKNALGPTIQDFQFVTCSGDRSVQVFEQVSNVEGNLDLVMMTAGENDLCLAGIIQTCVFLPFNGESKCQAIIDKAQQNVDTILKPNLKGILLALDDRMTADSVVVYNMYAQYFNTDNEACSTN